MANFWDPAEENEFKPTRRYVRPHWFNGDRNIVSLGLGKALEATIASMK